MPANDSYSFLFSMNFYGVFLDFLGAVLIIYFGLWPAINITNSHYDSGEYKKRLRWCVRMCLVGLLLVLGGFTLQLVDITSIYSVPL